MQKFAAFYRSFEALICHHVPYHTTPATPYRAITMTLHNNTKIQTTVVLSNAKLDAHTPFLRHLYIKCIILPRQARDKHGGNSKKGPNLCSLFSLTRQSRAGEGGNVFRSDFLLMLKTESLPRQARDRHRKRPEKGGQQHQIRSLCCCCLPARKPAIRPAIRPMRMGTRSGPHYALESLTDPRLERGWRPERQSKTRRGIDGHEPFRARSAKLQVLDIEPYVYMSYMS
jgi:hypothetical protein